MERTFIPNLLHFPPYFTSIEVQCIVNEYSKGDTTVYFVSVVVTVDQIRNVQIKLTRSPVLHQQWFRCPTSNSLPHIFWAQTVLLLRSRILSGWSCHRSVPRDRDVEWLLRKDFLTPRCTPIADPSRTWNISYKIPIFLSPLFRSYLIRTTSTCLKTFTCSWCLKLECNPSMGGEGGWVIGITAVFQRRVCLNVFGYSNIVASKDPGKNLNLRTNINAQQSTHNKAMIYKRNKFINRTNVSLRLATSSEYE